MNSHAVIEALDPIHDVQTSLGPSVIAYLVDALDLQGFEEAFHRRVVPGVALPAHRHRDPEVRRQPAVLVAGVLTAPVRVNEQPDTGLALPVGRSQGRAHQLRIDRLGHRPAHDAAARQIHHRGQIQPALARGDIGYVRHPRSIGLPAVEATIQDVGSHRQPMR